MSMRVVVLSDTHGKLPVAAYAELADCDHILHAGDICDSGILDELRTLAPVTAVLGNNDYPEYGEAVREEALFDLEGVRFLMTHTPRDLHTALRNRKGSAAPGQKMVDVAIHGHTHVPELLTGEEAAPAGIILCPGSVSRPRGGSVPQVVKLTLSEGTVEDISFVELH